MPVVTKQTRSFTIIIILADLMGRKMENYYLQRRRFAHKTPLQISICDRGSGPICYLYFKIINATRLFLLVGKYRYRCVNATAAYF